jgi:hypothetical protein
VVEGGGFGGEVAEEVEVVFFEEAEEAVEGVVGVDSAEGEVWDEDSGVHGQSDAAEGGVDEAVEFGEALVGREDSGDDDFCGAFGWEAVDAFDFEFELRDLCGGFGEAFFYFGEEGFGGVGEEFDGDVEIGGVDPADVGLGGGESLLDGGEFFGDFGRGIDGDE